MYVDDFSDETFIKEWLMAHETDKSIFQRVIDMNTDNVTKKQGDRILVWDSSRLTDDKTGLFETSDIVHAALANYESIVIEDGCKWLATVKTFKGDFTKNLDLRIWNRKLNKIYRTSSEFTKLHIVR